MKKKLCKFFSFQTPNNLQKGKEIICYVEYPRETLEKNILKIVSGKPYKHSYQK